MPPKRFKSSPKRVKNQDEKCITFLSLLDPSWIGLEAILGPILGSKKQKNIGKRKARATFLTPRWAQDRLKTGPRRVQERSKSHAFFVLIFDSFWGRLGVVLGVVLGSKIDPKSLGRLTLGGLDFDLVIGWSQDGPKIVPRALLGGSWVVLGGVLGRSWGLLGPLWAVWGGFWAVLMGSWAAFGSSWALFVTVLAAR